LRKLLTKLKPIVKFCTESTSALEKAEKCKEGAELLTGTVRAIVK